MNLFILISGLAALASTGFAARVVCYYANWSRYGTEPFNVEDIDPQLCTHVVYAFFGLENNGNIKSADPWNDFGDDWTVGGLTRFSDLKKLNPKIKLMIGVGGWREGPLRFQTMVKNPQYRKNFIDSTMSLIKQYNLDGLDINWIYQDSWGGTAADKVGLSALAKEMSPLYKAKGYLLSFATSANPVVYRNSYDMDVLSKTMDFINVMSYDLHGYWDNKAGHVAPLHPRKDEPVAEKELNVEAVIARHLKSGVPAELLNVGLVSFGRTFTLKNPQNHAPGAPTSGPGRVEPLPYREFCVQEGVWKKFYIDEQKVPYAVSGDQWVGIEDQKSLTEKVKFAKSKKLGGITFWTLDQDDFKGHCGSRNYPLLQAVKEEISRV